MATGLFDPAQLDAAVNDAFGIKPAAKAHPFAMAPNFEGMQPELNTRLTQAREAYRKQFGQELPITSAVRTRADQQRLFDRWKAGDKNIFMPVNPADHPDKQVFHEDAIDIPSSVPESFLKQFGIHRPLGARDPVHAVAMPNFGSPQAAAPAAAPTAAPTTAPAPQTAPQAPAMAPTAAPTEQTPGQLSVTDLMRPEAIDAAVGQAFGEPPKKGKVASKVTGYLREAAGLADTLYGVVPGAVGLVTYPVARLAGQSPEQAAQTQQSVTGAIDRPFGKAFGVTETPEYKGEASQQLMEFIGKNIDKGADWIAKNTGVPKSDVQYYMELGAAALPFTKTGRAVVREVGEAAGYVGGKAVDVLKQATPESVQRGVTRATEAVLPGTTTMPTRAPTAPTLGVPGQVMPETVAAGTLEFSNLNKKINESFKQYEALGEKANNINKNTNLSDWQKATQDQLDFLNNELNPLYEQRANMFRATGRGSIGAMGVPDATIVRQALQTATPEFQQLYGNMQLDKVNTPVVLRHLEGDSLPVPVRLTEGQATGNVKLLSEEMNMRGQRPELAYRLNEQNQQLVDNVPLIREKAAPDVYATKTIESSQALIDAYKTLDDARGTEISAAYKALEDAAGGQFPVDGVAIAKNAEIALAKKLKSDFLSPQIKTQLERFKNGEPMTFEQFEAMRTNLATEIRRAERVGDGNAATAASVVRQALEDLPLKGEAGKLKPLADKARSLANARFNALKKDPAYRAAVDDVVPADKFFDKFVVNGVNKNINTMVDTLGRDSLGHQHMKAGTINWLSDKAGIAEGRGNFSQANYNKALKKLDDVNNFGAIFDPESQLQLKTLGNVAGYTQFQPRGSYVNNSNTLVGYLANKAAGFAEGAGNVAGFKFMGGVPLGTMARQVVQSSKQKKRAERALKPGAGSTLDEISKKGQ